jgi:hypothetical protein
MRPFFNGRRYILLNLNFGLFRYFKSIVDLDTEVSDGAFKFAMTK